MAAAVLASAVALAACGGDDEPEATEPEATGISAEEWIMRADQLCADGARRTILLPLPAKAREIVADAAARAEVVTSVRNELAALDRPDEIDAEQFSGYIAELDSDIDQLAQSSASPRAGDGYVALDESAGVAAGELGLEKCAAFANAIARTP